MLLKTKDIKPNMLTVKFEDDVITKIDPIITIPEIALVPDIRGVCNVGGIFLLIHNPIALPLLKLKLNIIQYSIFILQI